MKQYTDREAFDAALLSVMPCREVARRFAVSDSSVRRLRKKLHLEKGTVRANGRHDDNQR